jgi:hypothetical protein
MSPPDRLYPIWHRAEPRLAPVSCSDVTHAPEPLLACSPQPGRAGRARLHPPGPRPLRPRRPGPDPGDGASPGRAGGPPARPSGGPRPSPSCRSCPDRTIGKLRPIPPGQARRANRPDLTGSGSLTVGKRPSPMRPRPLADLTRRRQVDAAGLGDHPARDRCAGRVPGRDPPSADQDLLGPGWLGDGPGHGRLSSVRAGCRPPGSRRPRRHRSPRAARGRARAPRAPDSPRVPGWSRPRPGRRPG